MFRGRIVGEARCAAAPQFAPAEHQIQREHEVGQGDHPEHPAYRNRGRPPLARAARRQDIGQEADDNRQRV